MNNIKITETIRSKSIEAEKWLTTIINALIAAYNEGTLKITGETIKCEKCHNDTTEVTITIISKWNLILFKVDRTIVIKCSCDFYCGSKYFRVIKW